MKRKQHNGKTLEELRELSMARASRDGVERGAELIERARIIHWLTRANVFAPGEIHTVKRIAESIEAGAHAKWCKANKVGQ